MAYRRGDIFGLEPKCEGSEEPNGEINLRMLIDELGAVVDLVVDHDEHILLGVVLSNILVGQFQLGSHCELICWEPGDWSQKNRGLEGD